MDGGSFRGLVEGGIIRRIGGGRNLLDNWWKVGLLEKWWRKVFIG